MLSISHALTGAFIAHNLPEPYLFVPLALLSHYFLDHIYHFDAGVGIKNGKRKLTTTFFLASADLLLALILVAVLWKQSPTNFSWQIWLGAFFGVLSDLLEIPQTIFRQTWHLKLLQPFYSWHDKFHRSTTNVFWGLLPQFILVSFIVVITLFNRS